MKTTFNYFFLGLAALALAACSDDKHDEPEMEFKVGSTEIQFTAENYSSQSVSITCSGDWTASTEASWIDLSPTSGDGDGTITITPNSVNTETSDRSAKVSVKSGEKTKEIQVVQKAALPFKVGANELMFAAEGAAAQTVTVTCSGEWTASTEATWIDL